MGEAVSTPELREAEARVRKLRKEARKAKDQPKRVMHKRVEPVAEGQRDVRLRDPLYLAWIRRQPCAVGQQGGCDGPIEAAHLRYSDAKQGRTNPGMQRKPSDLWVTPLCRHHHQHDQHKRSERAFWAERGIEPADLCRALRTAYDAEIKRTVDGRVVSRNG